MPGETGQITCYITGQLTCSLHGIRLYELCLQWADFHPEVEFEVDKFRHVMGLDGKYERMDHLKTKLIKSTDVGPFVFIPNCKYNPISYYSCYIRVDMAYPVKRGHRFFPRSLSRC